MANPQVENGHLKIANEVWDKLTAQRLSGSEFQIVMAVIRRTWGWKRKEDEISLADFCEITGSPERTVATSLKSLVSKNILLQTKGCGRTNPSKWSFNKDWEKWETLPKTAGIKTLPKSAENQINSAENGSKTLPKTAGISAENGRVSPCNSLSALEHEAPKAIFKERKASKASIEASSDPRFSALKKFISEEFITIRKCKIITDGSDWTKVVTLLKSTRGDPEFVLEKLQSAWTAFLKSPDKFHQKQGHPLRYWASNINAFIGNRPASREGGLAELRKKLEAEHDQT